MTGLFQDIRYAARSVRREPGFFAVAIAIIGLGVGAAAAVFSAESTDIPTFAAAAGLLFLVALAAGYLPALRASRIQPATALQES